MLSVPVLSSRTVVVEPTFRFEIREDFGSANTFGFETKPYAFPSNFKFSIVSSHTSLAYDPGAYLKSDDIKRRRSDVFSMELVCTS
jgi:hypothetical protein